MTPEQRDAVEAYIARARAVLRLRDWVVNVKDEPCADDKHAATFIYDDRHECNMQVSAAFWYLSDAERGQYVTHELIHLHMMDLYQVIKPLDAVLGGPLWSVIDKQVIRWEDVTVDKLSLIMLPLTGPLALPDAAAAGETPHTPTGGKNGSGVERESSDAPASTSRMDGAGTAVSDGAHPTDG